MWRCGGSAGDVVAPARDVVAQLGMWYSSCCGCGGSAGDEVAPAGDEVALAGDVDAKYVDEVDVDFDVC